MTNLHVAIIETKPTSLSVQRLFMDSLFSEYFGKYILCHTTGGNTYICKGTFKRNLHHNFIILDSCVVMKNALTPVTCRDNYLSQLESIPKIRNINSLSLKVIFKDTYYRVKWTSQMEYLVSSVRDILKLFCIASNCTVKLLNFPEFSKLGFSLLSVTEIGIKGVGKVTDSTKVTIEDCLSMESFNQVNLQQLPNAVGQDDVKGQLHNLLKARVSSCAESNFYQQVLLIGPAGSGKTTLLKIVCRDIGAVYIVIDFNDMKHDNSQEIDNFISKLDLAQQMSEESHSGLCVILIKRIDSFINQQNQDLSKLINLLDQCHSLKNVIVVATTDIPHVLPESLRTASRFGIELYLSIPTEDVRKEILCHLNNESNLPVSSYQCVAEITPGFVLSDLVLLCCKAQRILKSSKDECSIIDSLKLAAKEVVPSAKKEILGNFTKSTDYSMDQLGGLKNIKQILIQSLEWPLLHQASFKRLNLKVSSGVLLYGPPGCAKTSLARAISSFTKSSFLSVSAADLYSPYVGESEKLISHLFQRARANSPSVLFIDEIDALVGSRSSEDKGANEQVLTSFLTEMDGIGIDINREPGQFGNQKPFVFVIGATNRPDVIDSALLRPGRLDKLIYVPPPDNLERLDILEKVTAKMSLSADVSLSEIAERTHHFSGADITNLCNEAGLFALLTEGLDCSEIKMDHFVTAFNNLKPSLSGDLIEWYQKYEFNS